MPATARSDADDSVYERRCFWGALARLAWAVPCCAVARPLCQWRRGRASTRCSHVRGQSAAILHKESSFPISPNGRVQRSDHLPINLQQVARAELRDGTRGHGLRLVTAGSECPCLMVLEWLTVTDLTVNVRPRPTKGGGSRGQGQGQLACRRAGPATGGWWPTG